MADVVNYNIIIVPDDYEDIEDCEFDNSDAHNVVDDNNTIDDLWDELHDLKVRVFDLDAKLSKILDDEFNK